MATEAVGEEFITIVPVGESRPPARDPAFVTVLTVGAAAGAAEVVVRRPRGARLGLGLKFEGGSAAAEKVRRLLVQSCAEGSPAANAQAPWGKLIPGDEILAIDGVSVSELTRIDCVRRLKDSDETLTLLVRHLDTEEKSTEKDMDITDHPMIRQTEITRPTTLPPPVPPRKLGKKNSFKDKPTLQTVGEQNAIVDSDDHINLNAKEIGVNGKHNPLTSTTKLSRKSSFDSHIHRQNKEGFAYLKKGSPEEVRRLVRRLSDGKAMPPEAEVYIDLLSNEWERCLLLADAESDDTGSSISTVVDRLGSMASSVENSIPSTPIMQPKTIDIQKVLNCIENIDTNILKDITSNKFLEKQVEFNTEIKVEKPVATNSVANYENIKLIENIPPAVEKSHNDKNNNSVQNGLLECNKVSTNEKIEAKQETVTEKPKPMPRSVKVERSLSERKPRPASVSDIPQTSVSEPLLTPTKKNCIESWLQRSEAEMNNSPVEKLEEPVVPEALPRLIDFVPKPQFKEGGTEVTTVTRPTAPPPPPPAEVREDGSGASLDTIGELDESSDVAENTKPVVVVNEPTSGKPYDGSFWEDRTNKSDGEDKSLSNDETPLPTCPRQPPDGVETPSDAVEKLPEPASRLPPRLPTGWPTTTRPRYSYLRSQDARSEASVKDKIAMFSSETSSTDRLDKCGTLTIKPSSNSRKSTVNYSSNYPDISTMDRRLTKSQDNLDEMPRSYKRHMDRPEALGSLENATTNPPVTVKNCTTLQENKPMFYGSTTTLPLTVDTSFAHTVYHHTRSVSEDNGNKNIHKSNLEYLIEQRKKSMSKLRGLVIEEIQGPIVDLPEIKVQDNLAKTFLNTTREDKNTREHKTNLPKPTILDESKWKTNLLPNNLPKYSPAFKRKSLQVYTPSSLSKESTPERKFSEKIESISKMNNITNIAKPVTGSLDLKVGSEKTSTLPTKYSSPLISKYANKDYVSDYKNVEIKICTATDIVDSDNDSAMSSTQSSYRSSASSPMHTIDTLESDSSRMSPRISNYTTYSLAKAEVPMKSTAIEKKCEEYMKNNVCRSVSSDTNVSLSSSAGSAATSGSQASCSSLESSVADSDKRKVSKPYNIDTINRRNILASAKCRSGRDEKLNSPVVETKFSHESYDRSPSPTHKVSERLSTLTTSVSAVTNKGDNRRRSKVIAESDSDSDDDVNVRQRKTEFKNTRLKRNSSSGKNKQTEVNLDSPKAEDGPTVISEKIIKEIKKAGLDNFTSNKSQPLSDKSIIEITKFELKQNNKEKNEVKPAKRDIAVPIQKSVDVIDNKKPKSAVTPNGKVEIPDKIEGSPVKGYTKPSQIIRLKRGSGAGIGLILAGGTDCEAKDVTVHRVLSDSVAAKAGLKRGVKVRSINGFSMAGLTHAQSVSILKEQRSEVVIEIEDESRENANGVRYGSENLESMARQGLPVSGSDDSKGSGSVVTVVLEKAGGGAGLGFGLDGGRDSPQGDRPLTIKKLFAGGAAAQSGCVVVGAELLAAGGQSMEGFTRTQAWAALKALPPGPVTLILRNPTDPAAP